MLIILKKELSNYFTTYLAYILAAVFVITTALFLWFFNNDYNVYNSGNATLKSFFFIAPWLLLLLIPALTMRTIAEEEQNKTLEWLFSMPIKINSIVLGKFFAIVLVLLFLLLLTFMNLYIINDLKVESHNIEFSVIYSGYIGLFLVGITFTAIGIFCSSITKNPVIAYVSAVFLCFIFFYGFQSLASYNLLGGLDYYIQNLGCKIHLNRFLKGIIYLKSIIYFVCVIALFLLLSIYSINQKK